jgi:thiosulfate/3-mercaptopyruvate sulfurtransferase
VAVLEGGLPEWKSAYETETGDCAQNTASGSGDKWEKDTTMQWSIEQMRANLQDGAQGRQTVDARPPGRFQGEAPEPRPGLRLGHMPGAIK